MEIFIVLGMIGAFILGAHIRKPFEIQKKQTAVPAQKEEERSDGKPPIGEQWDNVFRA